MTDGTARPNTGLTVRQIPFEFPEDQDPHWNPKKPEWGHMVNGASLAMPYLEPYLIQVVRMGMKQIEDPELKATAADCRGQEGQHFRQHKRFNELLVSEGYARLPKLEAEMQKAYDARGLSMSGNVFNGIAFLLFYAGIVTVIWMVGVIAVKSLTGARDLR